MFNNPELDRLYSEYLANWRKAEMVLKKTERISNEVNMAAIQEMRYAARRVVDAQDENDPKKIHVHLIEANENLRKAQHDAVDACVAFLHDELDKLVERAGLHIVAVAYPQYSELRAEIRTISNKIVASRTNRQNLDTHYDEIAVTHLEKVETCYVALEESKPVIQAMKKAHRRDFWIAVGVVGGVVGLIVGVLAGSIVLVADKRGAFDPFTNSTRSTDAPVSNSHRSQEAPPTAPKEPAAHPSTTDDAARNGQKSPPSK